MDWIDEEIKQQTKYLLEAKTEKEEFENLIDGVENISRGFAMIAKFLKTNCTFSDRIERHHNRIEELRAERKEFEKQEAQETSQK